MKKLVAIYFLIFLFSCGGHQKVLKSTDLNYKYEKAIEYFEKEDFVHAMPIFRELSTMLRATKQSEDVNYYLAYCHYQSGDILTASFLFKDYAKTYPYGSHVEECLYMAAYSLYLASPHYALDDTYTKKSIQELQQFLNSYPNSSKSDECNKLIVDLNNKLALKAFEKAKQYYTTEYYKSAIIDLNNVLIDFPGNKYREEIYLLILKSSYELAINSISTKTEERLNDALDAFLVFNENYPESQYMKEAASIQKQTKNLLNK